MAQGGEAEESRVDFDIVAEPRGKVYRTLLEALWGDCRTFSLVYQSWADATEIADFRLRALPFLLHEEAVTAWPGTQLIVGPSRRELPTLATYQVTNESRAILLEVRGLYQWKRPKRPDDLALYGPDGHYWLGSVSHERLSRLSVPAAFLPRLKAIPNLRVVRAHCSGPR